MIRNAAVTSHGSKGLGESSWHIQGYTFFNSASFTCVESSLQLRLGTEGVVGWEKISQKLLA